MLVVKALKSRLDKMAALSKNEVVCSKTRHSLLSKMQSVDVYSGLDIFSELMKKDTLK